MSVDTIDKELCTKFTNYLITSVKVQEIKTITKDLDTSINDSYTLMHELRETFLSVQNMPDCGSSPDIEDDIARHEEISKFLESDPYRVLPADMEHLYDDGLDIDRALQEMKTLLEQIRSCDVTLTPHKHLPMPSDCDFSSDFEKTATSLETQSKRFANLKSIKCDGKSFQKDLLLEDKFHELVHHVKLFSKVMILLYLLIVY